MKTLTIATRASDLAVAQTNIVVDLLGTLYPDLEMKIQKIASHGDKDKNTDLRQIDDTGFFTKFIEDSLLAGNADIAVHSFKDLPTCLDERLNIAAVCDRKFPQDVLLAAEGINYLNALPANAKVATSSLRRIAQLKHLRPDLRPVSIRGNVETRLAKLDKGEFDAIILARAGLERLGLAERISVCFKPDEFIPAPAQGALAIETRIDDKETIALVSPISDKTSRLTSTAERAVLAFMNVGCHAPVGVFAKLENSDIILIAFISDLNGDCFIRQQIKGPADNYERLAKDLADRLLATGGRQILRDLEKT